MAYNRINFEDYPSTKTPIDAINLNHLEDGIFNNDKRLNELPKVQVTQIETTGTKIATIDIGDQSTDLYAPKSSEGGSTVEVTPILTTGTKIAIINVDGKDNDLYAPKGGEGGGSIVEVNPILTTGTKIATITVDGDDSDLYAPADSSGSNVEVTPIITEGTQIATITIDGNDTDIFAPNGGEGGSTVEVTQVLTEGTKIATITVDGNDTDIFAPGGGSGSATINTQIVELDIPTGTAAVDTGIIIPEDSINEIEVTWGDVSDVGWRPVADGTWVNANQDRLFYLITDNVVKIYFSSSIASSLRSLYTKFKVRVRSIVNGSGAGGINYSLEEQDTGLKWIDGRPVYQKSIYVNNIQLKAGVVIPHNIENLDFVIDYNACIIDTNAGSTYEGTYIFPTIGFSGGATCAAQINPTGIRIAGSDSWGAYENRHVLSTIKYVKTTD